MALYMKLPFADSGTEQANHAGWVRLETFQFDVDRSIAMEKGSLLNRKSGVPHFSEVAVSKELDSTSTALLQNLVGMDGGQVIEIHLVRGSEKASEATLKYKLKNAVFSHYSVSCSGEAPYETLRIAYSEIEMKFYAHDSRNKNTTSYNFAHKLAEG